MAIVFKASPTNCINPWANKKRLGDFFSHNYFVVWQSHKVSWRHFSVNFGIRRSDMWQICPVWFRKDNSMKSVTFGFWKFYFELAYHF